MIEFLLKFYSLTVVIKDAPPAFSINWPHD